MTEQQVALGLGAFLAGAAVAHVVKPDFFDAIVPESLPGSARLWTYASGAAELATAAAVLNPSTRRWGGMAAAALFVAVFPANIKDAADAFRNDEGMAQKVGTLVRLPIQLPLVLWGLRVGRRS